MDIYFIYFKLTDTGRCLPFQISHLNYYKGNKYFAFPRWNFTIVENQAHKLKYHSEKRGKL